MAGYRERANIYRINFGDDDIVGGAMVTGTLQYANVMTEMSQQIPSQMLLQQGLETQMTWTATVIPGTMDIRERDEYEPIAPFNHPYYGLRFRIVGVWKSTNLPYDPKNYMVLSLMRSRVAHDQQ